MASRSIGFYPEARAEADAAFDYYRERSIRIAEAFFFELEAAQTSIAALGDLSLRNSTVSA